MLYAARFMPSLELCYAVCCRFYAAVRTYMSKAQVMFIVKVRCDTSNHATKETILNCATAVDLFFCVVLAAILSEKQV